MPSVLTSIIGALGGPLGVGTSALLKVVGINISGGLLGNLLGLGPQPAKPATTDTPIKEPRPPRISAYGRLRLHGAYGLYETASDGTAVDVYAVHDGEMDGLEQWYLVDDKVTLSGSTVQQGMDKRYKDSAVHLYNTTGVSPGTAFSAIISLLPGIWTSAHRGDGVVMMALTAKAVKAKDFQETYPQSNVPTPSMVARWQKCPDPAAGDPSDESGWTWTENSVRHLMHYKMVREGVDYATRIAPTIAFWIAAAADCDEATPLDGITTATTADAAASDTHIVVASVTGLSVGMTFVINPAGVFTDRETKTVTSISSLTIHFSGGLSRSYASGTDVSWATDPAGGVTEARYRSCLAHNHTDAHKDVTAGLLSTFDGWIAPRTDGALVVYSGRYYAPTVSIGPDEIVSYNWDGVAVDDDTAVNEIIVSFVSADHDYNTVEAGAWRDEVDISARGKVLSQPLDAQIPSMSQGRRLAKRKMSRIMAPNRGTVTTNVAGRTVRGERFINLRIEEAGTVFYSGPAEITALTRNMAGGGVTFTWVAADPDIDDWNPSTEEGDPVVVGERVPDDALTTPTVGSILADIAGNGTRFIVAASGDARDDLTWKFQWRVAGDTDWSPVQVFVDAGDGGAASFNTDLVPAGQDIEYQVAYEASDGRMSDWTATATVTTDEVGVGDDVIIDGQVPL